MRNGRTAKQSKWTHNAGKHGEMDDLPNKVNGHIMEESKHGEMDDLPNKQVYINGHIYHKNILL